MADEKKVVIIGGPDAGKTNYIGRFWLALNEADNLLCRFGMPTNLHYIEEVAAALLTSKFAPHTPSDVRQEIHIPIKVRSGPSQGTLVLPDGPGELWMSVFRNREWNNSIDDLVRAASGFLIFLRVDSDQIVSPLDWVQCAALFGTTNVSTEDNPIHLPPTQIVVVDWLQFVLSAVVSHVGAETRLRVGFVFTAWDLAPGEQTITDPMEYLDSNFPLLGDFVKSNQDQFDFGAFGVSIFGDDPSANASFRAELEEKGCSQTGYVIHALDGQVKQSHDLTLPVAWSLGLTDTLSIGQQK